MRKPIVGGEEMDAAVEALAEEAMAVLEDGAPAPAEDRLGVDLDASSPVAASSEDSGEESRGAQAVVAVGEESGEDESTHDVTVTDEALTREALTDEAAIDETTMESAVDVAVDAATDAAVDIAPVLEALLFVSPDPLTVERCVGVLGQVTKAQVRQALAMMTLALDQRGSSLQIVQVAGGYRMVTRPQYAAWLRRLDKHKPQAKLSRSAVEALAIIAYRQPVVRGELEKIRGVETSGVIRTLMERKLVRIVGRKDEPGRPIMYGTTKHFLEHFGLRDLSELPPLQEFKELGEGDQSSLLEDMMVGNTDAEGTGLVEAPELAMDAAAPDMPLDTDAMSEAEAATEGTAETETAIETDATIHGEASADASAVSDELLPELDADDQDVGDRIPPGSGDLVEAVSSEGHPDEGDLLAEADRVLHSSDSAQGYAHADANGNGNGAAESNGHSHVHAQAGDADEAVLDDIDPISVAGHQ